jgi:hypothetical protein
VVIFFGWAAGLRVLRREGTGLFSFFLDFEAKGLFLAAAGIDIGLKGWDESRKISIAFGVAKVSIRGGTLAKGFQEQAEIGL